MCLVAEGASLGICATILPLEDGEPAKIISEARWTSNKRGMAYNNASYKSLFGGFGSEVTWVIFINWRITFLLVFAKTISPSTRIVRIGGLAKLGVRMRRNYVD